MTRLLFILLFISTTLYSQNNYQYKDGKPTSKGIDYYVKTQEQRIVGDYQKLIGDSLYNYYIETDDLSYYTDYDSMEAGRFYIPDDIIIDNQPKYSDYELSALPKYRRKTYVENNQFVKAVVFHELSHVYFQQIINDMLENQMEVSPEYMNLRLYINREANWTTIFIEEGFCEYITQSSGEVIPYKNINKPCSTEELLSDDKLFYFRYKYSSVYLKSFLDALGIKAGLMTILGNKPPSYEELLKAELYFNRLK